MLDAFGFCAWHNVVAKFFLDATWKGCSSDAEVSACRPSPINSTRGLCTIFLRKYNKAYGHRARAGTSQQRFFCFFQQRCRKQALLPMRCSFNNDGATKNAATYSSVVVLYNYQ